jgi:hypothetical protein
MGEPQEVHVTVGLKRRPKRRHRIWDIAAIILAAGLIATASGGSTTLFAILAAVFLVLYVIGEMLLVAKRGPNGDDHPG